MRRARLSVRVGLEGIRRHGIGVRRAAAAGLRESDRLPTPIFTPATKAESGHDINISEAEAGRIVGEDLVRRLRELTLALYEHGAAHAESRGIILADTKFEFGLTPQGEIILIDEVMTPDSSRYWPRDQYAPGGAQPSFDKQFVRDYLERDPLEQAATRAVSAGRGRDSRRARNISRRIAA